MNNIFFLFVYMIVGLFAARQLQIGLFRNARESGDEAAPLRSKKFHRLVIIMVFLFTGLPYLVARFIPGSQWFSAVAYWYRYPNIYISHFAQSATTRLVDGELCSCNCSQQLFCILTSKTWIFQSCFGGYRRMSSHRWNFTLPSREGS